MVTAATPGLWPGGWSTKKTTSKGVTIITATRGSLEKHRSREKNRGSPRQGKKAGHVWAVVSIL